jgi:hypothetical protein
MASRLRSNLAILAASFANDVLDAIRSASLEELLVESTGGSRRGPGRPRGVTTAGNPKARKLGRLKRRSAEEITKALDQVVALVKTKKDGLRAEQIKEKLGMDRREVPRVLKEGLAKKKLKAKGQKRATTYTAA